MSTGYLAAAFDLLNVRDLDLIEQATTRCEHLVVGVLSDEKVAERLGRPPIVPEEERMRLVAGVRGVRRVQLHEDWPDDHETSFVRPEDADLAGSRPVVILDSRRESSSQVLRDALSLSNARAVA